MSKHSAVLDHDPLAGKTKIFHRLHDGGWAYETRQDVAPVLDANKEAQNHCNPYNADKSMRQVARVPLIVFEKWRNDLGVDWQNPDHAEKIKELLNSSEWMWLRTDSSVL